MQIKIIYSVFQALGIICLVITAVIYFVVTPIRNYHGKALIGHAISLALAMILNACNDYFYDEQIYKYLLNLADFCHLLSHFWLTAMWFNVWCLSRFPKRIKLRNSEFIYSFVVIFTVTIALVCCRAGKILYCFHYFYYDKRGLYELQLMVFKTIKLK